MAVVVCRYCDGKQFKTQAAYDQHAQDNKKHKEKVKAQTQASQRVAPVVATTSQLPAHRPGYCKLCKVEYGTAEALQAHFDSGEYRAYPHPKCLRCGKAMESHAALDEVSSPVASVPTSLC